MKKTSKILSIILTILMVISIIPITASAATVNYAGDSVLWEIKNGVLMFGGSGEMYSYTSSTVPWRSYKDKIKEISIDEDITSIGDYAFYGLNITEVEIPEGVRKIGTYAFANCTSLSEVVIRKGVNIIDTNAFANCKSLKNVYYYSPQNDWGLINIRTGNNDLLNAELFVNGNGKISWEYEKETGTLTFSGNGVIPDFYIDSEDRFIIQPWNDIEKDIKHLVFNEGITSIGKYAFAHCSSLETITMSSVETIEHHAFYDCPVLKKLTTSNSLKTISRDVFRDCKKFTYIYYSGTQEEWNNVSIGEHWNDEMDKVKVYPSDYVVYSDSGTFRAITGGNTFSWVFDADSFTLTISGEGDMSGLFISAPWDKYKFDIERLVFDDGITSIGSTIFAILPNLTEVSIPESVVKISNQAFNSSAPIKDVYYSGTEEQWKAIVVGTNNESLLNANFHYNYVECEHNFDSFIVTEPTCQTRGYTTYICSICNDSYVDDYVDATCRYDAVITPPTCTEQGYTTYTCPVCENSYTDDYVDATGHGEYIVSSTTAPTCTKKGYTQYKCSNGCGDNYVKATADALGHSYVDVNITEPTCTTDGVKNLECSVCGNTTTQTLVVIGHNYSSEITTPATHTTTGVMTYTCACGDSYTEVIAKLEKHNYEAVITAPTCTEQGYTTYTCECGDSYVDDYVDATGHADNDGDGYCDACNEQLEDNNDSQISIISLIMRIINFLLELFGIN